MKEQHKYKRNPRTPPQKATHNTNPAHYLHTHIVKEVHCNKHVMVTGVSVSSCMCAHRRRYGTSAVQVACWQAANRCQGPQRDVPTLDV